MTVSCVQQLQHTLCYNILISQLTTHATMNANFTGATP